MELVPLHPAYLGMTAVGKQRKIAIAVDGSASSLPLVKWWGVYKLNAVDPQLESAWFQQPLSLQCDILLSKFAASNSTCTATKWAIKNSLKTGDEIHLLHSAAGETPAQTLEATAEVANCILALAEFQKDSELGSATSILLDMKGDLRDTLVDYVEDMVELYTCRIQFTHSLQAPGFSFNP
jgi:hypothetical protein